MKLKLPLLLLQSVLLLQSSLATEVFLDSNSGAQFYGEDTTINTQVDSLIFKGEKLPTNSTSHYFLYSLKNLNFQGDYSLTIEGFKTTGAEGCISGDSLSFQGLKSITIKNIISNSLGILLKANKTLSFNNVGSIEISGNVENTGGIRAFVEVQGEITFTNTGNITISNNSITRQGSVLFSQGSRTQNGGIYFSHVLDIVFSSNTAGVLEAPNISFSDIQSLSVVGNVNKKNGGALNVNSTPPMMALLIY